MVRSGKSSPKPKCDVTRSRFADAKLRAAVFVRGNAKKTVIQWIPEREACPRAESLKELVLAVEPTLVARGGQVD